MFGNFNFIQLKMLENSHQTQSYKFHDFLSPLKWQFIFMRMSLELKGLQETEKSHLHSAQKGPESDSTIAKLTLEILFVYFVENWIIARVDTMSEIWKNVINFHLTSLWRKTHESVTVTASDVWRLYGVKNDKPWDMSVSERERANYSHCRD